MMLDDWIKGYCYASIEEAQESGDGGTAAIEAVASAVDGYEKVENCQIGVNSSAFSLAKAGFMMDREIIDFNSGLKLNDSFSRTYSYQRSSSCRNPEAINMLTKSIEKEKLRWLGIKKNKVLIEQLKQDLEREQTDLVYPISGVKWAACRDFSIPTIRNETESDYHRRGIELWKGALALEPNPTSNPSQSVWYVYGFPSSLAT